MTIEQIKKRRSFQPSLADERLEPRLLLSIRDGIPLPKPYVSGYTVDRGRGDIIIMPTGETFKVTVTDAPFRTDGGPTIRFRPYHGQVDLFVYGSTVNTTLEIDPQPHPALELRKGRSKSAYYNGQHTFPLGTTKDQGILPIHNITVETGRIARFTAIAPPICTARSSPTIPRRSNASRWPTSSRAARSPSAATSTSSASSTTRPSQTVDRLPSVETLNWLNVGNTVTIGRLGNRRHARYRFDRASRQRLRSRRSRRLDRRQSHDRAGGSIHRRPFARRSLKRTRRGSARTGSSSSPAPITVKTTSTPAADSPFESLRENRSFTQGISAPAHVFTNKHEPTPISPLASNQLVIPLVRCMNAVSRLISSSLKRVSSYPCSISRWPGSCID